MRELSRRLDRLEQTDPELVLVPCYPGMTEVDGYRMRFGADAPPHGVQAVVVMNAMPEANEVPYDWWHLDHESDAFRRCYALCKGAQ